MVHMPVSTVPAELWALNFGNDAVRCVAFPHPLGVELRYVMNEHPLIGRVLPEWNDVERLALTWKRRLEARGWTRRPDRH
jgi:hypothetical protein